ncbi:MAG: SGNH/GDSL hydrolase family protein, partial [Phycisphaeraceae bacterium]|nr:SGNH/GDSL hydrolase family protein [Phycisphaeraceae bacterium]
MSTTRQFGVIGLAAAALAWAGVCHAAPIQMNLKATFADTKAKITAGGQADIVVLGDSLAFDGLGWSSWVPYFRGKMQTRYGNAGAGYQSFSTLSGVTGHTGSWVFSGPNQDHSGQFAIDGLWGATAQAGSTAWFIFNNPQAELYYRTDGRAGSFNILGSTGQVLTTIDSRSNTPGVGVWSHDFGTDPKFIQIQATENEMVTILGAQNKTSNPGVRVDRASNSGYRLVSYLQRDVSFDQEMSLLAPDLVVLAIGQNDGGIPSSDYLRLYSDLLDRISLAAPSTEILVVTPYNSGSGHLPYLIEWQAQVAAAHNVGFLNLYSGIANGSRSFWWNNGYLYSD